MRTVRYNVAASLDGYIAGPNGEYDWIPEDPGVDFGALFANVDTVLMGRRTYELVLQSEMLPWERGTRVYVFSRTMRPEDHPDVTVVADDVGGVVARLREEEGTGEIWLFGGGDFFSSVLAEGLVDTVEITIVPILLGGGVPLLGPGAPRTLLTLTGTHTYPSGMVALTYAVSRGDD